MKYTKNVPQKSKEASIDNSAKAYLMILDGQQRLQSLLLALGGKSWSFTQTDKEWKKDIYGKETNIDSQYWSTGCLCIEVDKFLSEYEKCNKDIPRIDVENFLCWAITDKDKGYSYKDREPALPIASLEKGNFIRFSEIWDMAKSGLMPCNYEDILKKSIFSEIPSETLVPLIKPLSEFMTVVAEVKHFTYITRLTIKEFEKSGIDDRSFYNNAIVNIFARLNTAGRTLTRQEITLAWLKLGWNETTKEQEDCGATLEELLIKLNGYDNNGMQLSIDNLVDILSLFWIITERNGDNQNELILNDKDLVNGNIMKNIGNHTYEYWPTIEVVLLYCKKTFESRGLSECFAQSNYAFYFICGWIFIAAISSDQNKGRKRETEIKFDTQINGSFDMFIDKWFFSTLLADTWSTSSNYLKFVGRLCKLHKSIKNCNDPQSSIVLLTQELDIVLSDLKQDAIRRIDELHASKRNEVIAYKNVLWLWNRLSPERWDVIEKPMKRKKAAPRWEVDHAIPIDIWNDIVEKEYPLDSTEQELSFDINGKSYTRKILLAEINNLGNCSLLLRSHNRSKGKEPFGKFLSDIYNSKEIEEVKNTLLLNDVFLYPSNVSINPILTEIDTRNKKIKEELKDYFNNKERQRQDV